MASFKAVIRGFKSGGLATVYIRITHNQQVAYMKTGEGILAFREIK